MVAKAYRMILFLLHTDTGSRNASEEDKQFFTEEDEFLAHYLSKCKLDKENHHLSLPENHEQEDQGFKCTFYRKAKERMFEVSSDEERFTIIVLDQKGWDSDTAGKRAQEQVGTLILNIDNK